MVGWTYYSEHSMHFHYLQFLITVFLWIRWAQTLQMTRGKETGYWIARIAIWRNICQHVKWLNNLLQRASGKQARHNNLWSKAIRVQTLRGWVTFAIVLNLKHISFRVYVHLWASIKLHHIIFSFYILNDIETVEMKTDDTFIVLMNNILRWNFHILVACAPPKCKEFTYQIMLCDFSKSIFIMN